MALSKEDKQILFDSHYFESGKKSKLSGYSNYFASIEDIFEKAFVQLLIIKVNPKHVLDIGYGKGTLIYYFRQYGVDAVGVNVSKYIILNSPVKEPIRWVDLDNEKLPFPDDYFNLIVSRQSIEHISNLKNALHEVHRVLDKNGYFIFRRTHSV